MFRVARPETTPVGEEQQQALEAELRKVCSRYGVELRQDNQSTTSLRDEDRRQRGAFWRSVLEEELPQKWFNTTDAVVANLLSAVNACSRKTKVPINPIGPEGQRSTSYPCICTDSALAEVDVDARDHLDPPSECPRHQPFVITTSILNR